MLTVGDVFTSYGMIKALNGVTLSASEGEITCLLGPNGAGKTTLMFTIAGILRAQAGSIKFDGQSIERLSAAKVVEAGIALVPENRLVFPTMSVEENLEAGAFIRVAKDRAGVDDDIERMYMRFPVLKERREQMAGTLSGGEQQMLALARALMSRPRILLMDEPSVGLAPLIVEDIFQIIRDVNADGMTILLVEQNANMALSVADKFYLLEHGRVTFEGAPGELEQDEVIRRAYLGTE
ncbi:MAG: ABC transporter ATP-binding protein [Alphaproteobacteria bacterium]|nr:ABC transporter ATP-binding protein [Alphaproteobacteria bacterium]